MSDSGDESGDEQAPQKNHLRFTTALTEVPNGDAEAATELLLNSRGITSADSLESFKNIKKLELKENHLSKLDFLEMNHSLCWLNLARNRIRKLKCIENLSALVVLDLSDNKLTSLDGMKGLRSLKALIAARNLISRISGISPKGNPSLETLVLSHNKIQECSVAGFQHLKKLSVANNKLHAWPALDKLPNLSDLRLNGNRITKIPQLSMLPRLSSLDVGNNLITEVQGFESLRGLLWLRDLNIRGNTAAGPVGEDPPAAVQGVISSLQRLEILNGRRLSGKAKKKRRTWEMAGEKPGKLAGDEASTWHSQSSVGGTASSVPDEDADAEPSFDRKKLRNGRGARGRGRGRGHVAEDDSDADDFKFGRGRGRGRGGAFVGEDFDAQDLMPLRGTGQARGRGQPRHRIAAPSDEHDSVPRQEIATQAQEEKESVKTGIKKKKRPKLAPAAAPTEEVSPKAGTKKKKRKLAETAATAGQLQGPSKRKRKIKAKDDKTTRS